MGANDSFGGALRSVGDYSEGKSGYGLSPMKTNLKPVSIDGGAGNKGGHEKQAAFDTKSVGGRTNKSENYDDKTVQELDEMIEQAEKEIQVLDKQRRILKSSKLTNNKAKQQKLKPIDEQLRVLRVKCEKWAMIKDSKIPFWEKLPKDSQFYKHYMNLKFARDINEAAAAQANEDRELMQKVKEKVEH